MKYVDNSIDNNVNVSSFFFSMLLSWLLCFL